MLPIVALLATAREPRTAAELWEEIQIMRRNKCEATDLPLSKSELERMLRMQRFAGRVAEAAGEDGVMRWTVVAEKREPQKALF